MSGLPFVCIFALVVTLAHAHVPREVPLRIRPGNMTDAPSQHTDNWAVIVSTSRFWHNYRHTANALSVYRMARDAGIPDSHIVLMIADDTACDPRNVAPTRVFATKAHDVDVMCADTEIDYAGDSVTAINFLRVLMGRVGPDGIGIHPGHTSNVLVYVTGHSGEQFMKFHDYDFMTSYDLADAVAVMERTHRYHRMFIVLDTCQAETLYAHITSRDVVALASSREYENSISHPVHVTPLFTAALVDGFTGEFRDGFYRAFGSRTAAAGGAIAVPSDVSLLGFFDRTLNPEVVRSHHITNVDRAPEHRDIVKRRWKLVDFFSSPPSTGWVFE